MGGTVAVTLRMPSGEEFRMRRWTNVLPWFYNNIRFFEKDPAHIEEYLSQWRVMKDDWERNRTTGKFENNMTESYAPYPAPLAPEGYGIVVFDLMKNVVISCQGYCSFTRPHLAFPDFDQERYEAQLELFDRRRVKRVTYYNGNENEAFPKTRQELEALRETQRMVHIEYDTSPLVVHDVGEGLTASLKAKKLILDLGFVLTEEDEKGWKEWESYHEDEEGDDEEPEESH